MSRQDEYLLSILHAHSVFMYGSVCSHRHIMCLFEKICFKKIYACLAQCACMCKIMYHRALCGCGERMFVYAHSIESIVHLLYAEYVCMHSICMG